jgi:hypothetical protein
MVGANGLTSSPEEQKRSDTVLLFGAKLGDDELWGDEESDVVCGEDSL